MFITFNYVIYECRQWNTTPSWFPGGGGGGGVRPQEVSEPTVCMGMMTIYNTENSKQRMSAKLALG